MKTQSKHAYVRCEVNVTEFNVEREFATGSPSNAFTNAVNGWEMTADGGEYKNEQYGYLDDIGQWADDNNPLK